MNRMQNKVAIVTGGAAGLGRATVELFAAEGATVSIWDVNAEQGQSLAAGLDRSRAQGRVQTGRRERFRRRWKKR